MAQIYTSGPILIGVQMRNAGVLPAASTFLGTGETAPEITVKAEWEPVMNDLGGTKIPFDVAYEGEEAFISVKLTRWNQTILNLIQNRPYRAGAVRGTNSILSVAGAPAGYGDMGSMMITEGLTFGLQCYFPYSVKAAYRNPANGFMPPGMNFPAAMLMGPEVRRGGTKAQSIQLVFHALRDVVLGAGSSAFVLYNETMPAIAFN